MPCCAVATRTGEGTTTRPTTSTSLCAPCLRLVALAVSTAPAPTAHHPPIQRIKAGEINPLPSGVSEGCRTLLMRLLEVDPGKRYKVEDLCQVRACRA